MSSKRKKRNNRKKKNTNKYNKPNVNGNNSLQNKLNPKTVENATTDESVQEKKEQMSLKNKTTIPTLNAESETSQKANLADETLSDKNNSESTKHISDKNEITNKSTEEDKSSNQFVDENATEQDLEVAPNAQELLNESTEVVLETNQETKLSADEDLNEEKNPETPQKNKDNSENKDDSESKNDSILEKGYLTSLIKQGEGDEESLVFYEVTNIYSNTKKKIYKNKYRLKKEPPLLTIKDSEDNLVEFELTENFTNELMSTLNEVKRAYYGFEGPVDINAPDKFLDKVKYYVSKNPVKLILLVGIFIYFFIINFI